MDAYVETVLSSLANIKSKAAPGELLEMILQDYGVKNAHQAFLQSLDSNEILQESHGLAVQVLNRISAAYYENALLKGDAVIFTRHSKPPTGDILELDVKPEICGFLGPLATLLLAHQHPNYKSHKAWSTLVEVAELERDEGERITWGKIETYVASLKRYRPDMTTVHGICLAGGHVQLATLNPAGTRWSNRTPWTDLSPWIAHVAEVYNSLSGRDPDMMYCVAQEGFPRWDVRKAGVGLAVTPFYVGHAPGRTTFACFEVGRLPDNGQGIDPKFLADLDEKFESGVVQGFWKFSWQRTVWKPTELELLTYLHRDGWVPGLVRHYPETSMRGEDATAVHHPLGRHSGDTGWVRDILHLGSIGQPLSQCETAGDLLDVMYDLIETHAHLCELGVLHRDISYFNVMCKPKHYVPTHPVLESNCVLERPCIKKIFGDENGQSCVLLTDLDHATTFSELAKQPIDANTKTVGTPMFKSVHLSAPSAAQKFPVDSTKLSWIVKKFEKAENAAPEIFQRAFPNGDGDFLAKFRLVVAAEIRRKKEKKSCDPVPPTQHSWYHDAESIYWVFVYAFARARPLDIHPKPKRTKDRMCESFFSAMMTAHAPTRSQSGWDTPPPPRATYLQPGRPPAFSFMLEYMEVIFKDMATYFSIPWHLYCGADGIMAGFPDHAHVAMRRLILGFKVGAAHSVYSAHALRVRLDTARPRSTTEFDRVLNRSAYMLPPETDSDSTLSADTQFSAAERRVAETQAAIILGCAPLDAAPGPQADVDNARDDDAESATPADSCTPQIENYNISQIPATRSRGKRKACSESTSTDDASRTVDCNRRDLHCAKRLKPSPYPPSRTVVSTGASDGDEARDEAAVEDVLFPVLVPLSDAVTVQQREFVPVANHSEDPQSQINGRVAESRRACTDDFKDEEEDAARNDEDDPPKDNLEDESDAPTRDGSEGEPPKAKKEQYDAGVHCHLRSAKALRLMVLKDRAKWFSRGKFSTWVTSSQGWYR